MSDNSNTRGATVDDLRCSAVPATADRLPALRHVLSNWAERAGLSHDRVEELTLAAYEAMANVVEHAYPNGDGTFDVFASSLAAEGVIEVSIVDHGRWQPPPSDPGPLHGRGVPLMGDLSDNVDLYPSAEGTTAILRWTV